MIARPRPVLRRCEGLTALETAAVLFITAIVAVPLLAIAARIVALPVEWQADMEAARDAREIMRQVADDARQASCVRLSVIEDDPEASSTQWTFTWVDHAISPERLFEVIYSRREDDAAWVREETVSEVEAAEVCLDGDVVRVKQISEEEKIIGPVAYFDIGLTPIPGEGTNRCIVKAHVQPSRPEDAPIQEIAAMMRPDDARCEQPPQ